VHCGLFTVGIGLLIQQSVLLFKHFESDWCSVSDVNCHANACVPGQGGVSRGGAKKHRTKSRLAAPALGFLRTHSTPKPRSFCLAVFGDYQSPRHAVLVTKTGYCLNMALAGPLFCWFSLRTVFFTNQGAQGL